MKKLFAFILLLIYFTVSTGFVVSVHYCMNKVASVELGDSHRDECGKCGMHIKKADGCCKDDVKVVKLKTEQNAAKIAVADFSLSIPVLPSANFFVAPFTAIHFTTYPLAHGPPLSYQDTYLLNGVFRI